MVEEAINFLLLRKKIIISFIFLFCFLGMFFIASAVSAATIYVNSATGDDATGDGTSGTPYKTFHKGYTMASSGDTLDMTGTFTWSDAGETGDATGSGYTISKDIIIVGHGATSTIFQPATAVASSNKRVFTVSSGYSLSIASSTVRFGDPDSSGWNGGCIYTNPGASLTLDYSEVHDCRIYGGYGIGIWSNGNTTITNSSIYNNIDSIYNGLGAGMYFASSTANLIITNSSFYNNQHTSSGSNGGGGVYIQSGTATITNSTFTGNLVYQYGGGVYISSGNLYLANTVIAGNTASVYSDLYIGGSATLHNNGYNIIGGATSGFSATTGDWTDTNSDGTYNLYSIGTTGSANLDSTGYFHDGLNQTHTNAVYTGSIAINNATTTANNGISIPGVDQRGAGRTGATDIGAFEFDGTGLSSVSEPTTQATSVTFSSVIKTQMTVGWTAGDGARRIAFMKQANTGTATPVDTTDYTASSVFGGGDQVGATGWYAIYDGTGTSVTVTGLTASTDYIVQVFEYNGIGTTAEMNYMTASSTNNPNTNASYTSITIYVNSSTGNDSTGDGTSGNPYKTFHKGYTSVVDDDTLDMTGTFTWSDAGETGDASDSGYTIAKDIVIVGRGASSTIFQSASAIDSSDRRVFTVSAGYSFSVSSSTIRYGEPSNSGGCIYTNSGSTLALNYSEVTGCRWGTGYGLGIYSLGNTTITNSSIYDNVDSGTNAVGGAIYFASSTADLIITNSSIYGNRLTSGSTYGGALYINSGTATITNSTITGNFSYYNGGIYQSAGTLYLANTIVAGNTLTSGTLYNIYKGGTITSNGYNIIGASTATIATTTGDWYDGNNDGIYNLYASSTTGSLNLDSAAGLNSNLFNTQTYALLADSIAINNATTTANNGISIPALDQRGAARNGATDIGAYEYNGLFDVYYTLTYSAGANGSLTGSTTQNVMLGASGEAVTAVPDSGYMFTDWSDASTANPRTDTSVSTNVTVTANFDLSVATLTYTAGAGGSLTGSSTQIVDAGADGTAITAVPDAHYHFVNWSDASTANPRTDTSVMSDVNVTANFSIDVYPMTYSAGAGGSLTGSTTQIVDYASSTLAVTAVPDTGYSFTGWSDASSTNPRVDYNVTSANSLTANFAINTYTVTYSAGVNGSLTGSSTQIIDYASSTLAVTAVPDSGYRFVNWDDDSTDNPRTDLNVNDNISVTAVFALLGAPGISSVSSTPTASTSAITWTTDIAASTKIVYGPTTSYSASTAETNISSRVTSHSATLSSLASCATFHYQVISANINNLYATSTDYSFITSGCAGSSAIATSTNSTVATTTTSTVSLLSSSAGISLAIPIAYASSSADFQIKKLVKETVSAAVGRPSGYIEAGDYVYNLTAITEELQTISTFDQNLTITMSYTDADVSGIVESTLKIFRWDGSNWNELPNCAVNESANTVTCDTGNFSTFGLYGQAAPVTAAASSPGGGGGNFIPPSTPTVSQTPFMVDYVIKFNVTDAVQMAISDDKNFTTISWQDYSPTYSPGPEEINKTLYVKFRSKAGGESDVYKIIIKTDAMASQQLDDQTTQITSNVSLEAGKLLEVISVKNKALYSRLKGKIILKVEEHGEAYYVHPVKLESYYLGRPDDAFSVMREQGIGITNDNLQKIPIGLNNLTGPDADEDGLPDLFEDAIGTDKNNKDSDNDTYDDKTEINNNYDPNGPSKLKLETSFANKQKGKIFLQVEGHGEAWYINYSDGKRYFLGRPADAFQVMRNLGLGISNINFKSLSD